MALVVRRLRQAESTQDEARRLVEAGEAKAGYVIVADEQTAGRGRFGREWLSPIGGLYATYIASGHRQISMVSGIAVLRALNRCGVQPRLKWPNDVIVGGRKLAGILIETAGEVVLVGVGVNLREAPIEGAVSVRALGGTARRGELVVAIWDELSAVAASKKDVRTPYRECLATLGRPVIVTLERGDTVEGTAVDVDDDGGLVVQTASGIRSVSSGECVHLRS